MTERSLSWGSKAGSRKTRRATGSQDTGNSTQEPPLLDPEAVEWGQFQFCKVSPGGWRSEVCTDSTLLTCMLRSGPDDQCDVACILPQLEKPTGQGITWDETEGGEAHRQASGPR